MEKLYRKFGCSIFYLDGEKFNSEKGIRLSLELDTITYRPYILNVYVPIIPGKNTIEMYLRIYCITGRNTSDGRNTITGKNINRPSRSVISLLIGNVASNIYRSTVLNTDYYDARLKKFTDELDEHGGSKFILKKIIREFYEYEELRSEPKILVHPLAIRLANK